VRISLIGTGLMGLPMAERLLSAQHSLTAYNRTAAKLDSLQQLGAAIASSPQAAIAASDCLVLMLTDAAAIHETILAERSHLSGKTVIQMGTIAPEESQAIRDQVVAAGGEYLEAPVLGSIPEAKSGTLIVMVGAEPAQFERWLPVLQCFGPDPILLGDVGSAAAVKLALNQLIGSLTSAFALSLGLVQRQGADVSAFMNILRQSALYAPTFDKKLDRMLNRNFEHPNFPTKHLKKDMDLFIRTAIAQNLRVDSAEGVQKILADAGGLADTDYSALFSIISPES
jgi:3-hydroxyisobutyrate dehydrogenase